MNVKQKFIASSLVLFFGILMTSSLGLGGPIFLDPGGPGGGTGTNLPPGIVTNLQVTQVTGSLKVKLTWYPPSDNDILYFKVYRDGSVIATPSTCIYFDDSINSLGTYKYKVAAVDWAANVGPCSTVKTFTASLQWYNSFPEQSGFPDDKDLWVADYVEWMNTFTKTAYASGTHKGNDVLVSFVPKSQVSDGMYFNLPFAINVRALTGMPGPDDWYSLPQAIMDDAGGTLPFPAPMAVNCVKLKGTLLPESGGTSSQDGDNSLWIKDAGMNSVIGQYFDYPGFMETLMIDGHFEQYLNYVWLAFGTNHGYITIDPNYRHGNVYGDMGLFIRNDDDGVMGVEHPEITHAGSRPVISFWGKRDSTDYGNTVGLRLKLKYVDNSEEIIFPEELKITETDNIWRHYQLNLDHSRAFRSITPELVNCEKGSAYFDQVYIGRAQWFMEKYGNYSLAENCDTTYNRWKAEVEEQEAFNDNIDWISASIGLLSTMAGFGGVYGMLALADFLGLGGHLLNFAKYEIPDYHDNPYVAKGGVEGDASFTKVNDHSAVIEVPHSYDDESDFGYALALDDSFFCKYQIDYNGLQDGLRGDPKVVWWFEIEVTVIWSYIGQVDSTDSWGSSLQFAQNCIEADRAVVSFKIPVSNVQWSL